MAGSFPTLKSGNTVFYPLKRTHSFGTGLLRFMDDSEQRWRSRNMLNRFELVLNNVNGYDSSLVLKFWRSQFGKFDSTWDLTIGGTLYSNLAFDSDEYEKIEEKNNRHTLKFPVVQTRSSNPTIPTLTRYFPQITGGVMTSLPYTSKYSYKTDTGDMPTGKRYVWKWRPNALGTFNIVLTGITDAELATVQNFFYAAEGRLKTFQLMDPGGNLVRYSDDFSQAAWIKTASVGAAQQDPFKGNLATRIGTGNLETVVLPDGDALGYVFTVSAWVKAVGTGTSVVLGFSAPTNQTTTWELTQGVWTRVIHTSTFVSSNAPATALFSVFGGSVDMFSCQCVPMPGPGPRLLTPGNDGLRAKCRFDSDDLVVTYNGKNDNSVTLPVVEFV